MSCRRSQEIELADFLAHPRAGEFDAFRAHYPTCAECSGEVRAWTELHESLAAAHPEVEDLAGYASLGAVARAAVDRHLAGCAACRDELHQLAGFDAAAWAAPAAGADRPGRDWLAWLRELFWHPAFAYALLLVVLVPTLYRTLGPAGDPALRADLDEIGRLDSPSVRRAVREEREAGQAAGLAEPAKRAPQAAADEAGPERPGTLPVLPAAPPTDDQRELDLLETFRDPELEAPVAGSRMQRDEAVAEVTPRQRRESGLPVPRAAERMLASEEAALPESKRALAKSQAAGAPTAAMERLADSPIAAAVEVPPPARLGVVRMEGGQTWEVRVPLPPGLAPGDRVEVHVRSADGARWMLERREIEPESLAAGLALRVPASWLEPGEYRVEVRPPGARRPLSSLRLDVPGTDR